MQDERPYFHVLYTQVFSRLGIRGALSPRASRVGAMALPGVIAHFFLCLRIGPGPSGRTVGTVVVGHPAGHGSARGEQGSASRSLLLAGEWRREEWDTTWGREASLSVQRATATGEA